MHRMLTCPQGHQWEADRDGQASQCPVCGVQALTQTLEAQTLPPRRAGEAATLGPTETAPTVPGYDILEELGGLFPDGFHAVFADGTVRFIKNTIDEKILRALITRDGGEQVDLTKLQ